MLVTRQSVPIWLAIVAGFALAGGCSDPRYQRAAARRAARIDQHLTAFDARERDAGRRLAEIDGRIHQAVADHELKFIKSAQFLHRAQQKAIDCWPSRCERAKTSLQEQLEGNTQRIDKSIPLLFY